MPLHHPIPPPCDHQTEPQTWEAPQWDFRLQAPPSLWEIQLLSCPSGDNSAAALCSLVGRVRLIGDVYAFPGAFSSSLYIKKNYFGFSMQNFPPSALPWQNVC